MRRNPGGLVHGPENPPVRTMLISLLDGQILILAVLALVARRILERPFPQLAPVPTLSVLADAGDGIRIVGLVVEAARVPGRVVGLADGLLAQVVQAVGHVVLVVGRALRGPELLEGLVDHLLGWLSVCLGGRSRAWRRGSWIRLTTQWS